MRLRRSRRVPVMKRQLLSPTSSSAGSWWKRPNWRNKYYEEMRRNLKRQQNTLAYIRTGVVPAHWLPYM